jgi:hypothetical protein
MDSAVDRMRCLAPSQLKLGGQHGEESEEGKDEVRRKEDGKEDQEGQKEVAFKAM